MRLILATPTITSMKATTRLFLSYSHVQGSFRSFGGAWFQDAVVEGDGECEIIVGLTKEVKAMLLSTCNCAGN